jgi:hypothetical protein
MRVLLYLCTGEITRQDILTKEACRISTLHCQTIDLKLLHIGLSLQRAMFNFRVDHKELELETLVLGGETVFLNTSIFCY